MSSADPAQSSSRGIFAEIVRLQRAGRACLLAAPLWSRGSVPLRHHSKLLYRDDGTIQGTIGGGLLEGEVLAAAPEVMSQGAPRVLEFDLTPTDAADSGMICGGRCAVLLEPIAPDYAPDIFVAAARAEQAGEPIVLITLLPPEGSPGKLALSSVACTLLLTAHHTITRYGCFSIVPPKRSQKGHKKVQKGHNKDTKRSKSYPSPKRQSRLGAALTTYTPSSKIGGEG